jgi:predicted glycosyltransferase
MRVWVDVTNSPHVAFFRPLVALLRARGHDVSVTARDYAQTLELLDAAGLDHEVVGPPHAGARAAAKTRAMARRVRALRAWAGERDFDLALAHGSHEQALTARSLGVPEGYAHDYEWASWQHRLGMRAATRVVVPEAIPQERLDALGAKAAKVRRYPGLKEEYYLSGFEPDPSVLARLGVDPGRVLVVVRTPPDVSLYHRHGNPLLSQVVERLGTDPDVEAVVLPRTSEQRATLCELHLPSLVVPPGAVDALSLVALADLVVGAGGTMNREAVALGTPVLSTFAGERGAVDERLIAEGRLGVLRSARDLAPAKKQGNERPPGRDPALLLDLLLSALG